MSASVSWRPVKAPVDGVDYTLASLIADRLMYDGVGGMNGARIGMEMIPWLSGVRAAGSPLVQGAAAALITAINKHGEIELVVSY